MTNEIIKLSKFKLSITDKTLIDNTDENSCDLVVNSGELVLICGANGSGKTTLIKKIIGTSDTKIKTKFRSIVYSLFNKEEEKKYDGIDLEGEPVFNGNPIEDGILDEIGFAPNDSDLKLVVDETVTGKAYIDATLNWKYKENVEEINRLFERFYGNRASAILKRKISKCSSGEQKKLSIISALVRKNKKLYFFDEPMNCLDTNSMIVFMEEIRNLMNSQPECGVVIITHCLLFDNPDRVYKISNSKLVDDTKNYKKRDCLDYLVK